MKKKFISVLLCGAMTASLFGMGAMAEETKTFTVGFDAEYPPYGYMGDDGEYTGFDLELAQAVCDLEGWELVKTPINWESKDMELDSGSIDCIWNGFTMTGREDDYTWSQPYVDNSQVDGGEERCRHRDARTDLAGKTVGVQAASAALNVLQDEEQQKSLADTFASTSGVLRLQQCICRAAGRCRRCHRDGHRSSQLSDFYQRQRR